MTTDTELATGLRMVWDDGSRDYPVRALLDPTAARQDKDWPCNVWLDQLSEGACVGFCCGHEAAAEPVAVRGMTDAIARSIYKDAQKIDEWPGESYEGTSMLAGAKIMKSRGFWSEYRWCFGVDDLIDTMCNLGPVCFATPWYSSMFAPDREGRMHISGVAASAHAYLGRKIEWSRGRIWMRNSWMKKPDGSGSFWGINGEAWMPLEDWDKLLKQGGQVMVPVKRTDPAAPEPVPPPPAEPTLKGATKEQFLAEFLRRNGDIAGIDINLVFRGGTDGKTEWPRGWRD